MTERKLEIHVYEKPTSNGWVQAKFMYSGLEDVGWTDDPEVIIKWIKKDLEELEIDRRKV